MALTATVHHLEIALSDVDRGVYESLDLRVARHPSETLRYLWTRTLGYCLSYEEGIAFSKGGVSAEDEPPIAIRDRTGAWVAWIEVGSPSAERLHKATRTAPRVALFTHVHLALLQREAARRAIHKVDDVDVRLLEPGLVDALAEASSRAMRLEIVRSDDRLYVTVGGRVIESSVVAAKLR